MLTSEAKNSPLLDTSVQIVNFPDSPFQLHQPFAPAGDQPNAIAKLVEGIDDGLRHGDADTLWAGWSRNDGIVGVRPCLRCNVVGPD